MSIFVGLIVTVVDIITWKVSDRGEKGFLHFMETLTGSKFLHKLQLHSHTLEFRLGLFHI